MNKNINLTKFFNPHSIAIIGTSNDKNKIGRIIFDNINHTSSITTIPVNPQHKQIADRRCYTSVTEYSKPIDLVIICVKAEIVPHVLEEAGRKKIPFVIVISSGFRESGDDGKRKEEKILEIARKHNIKLLGPNCLGYVTNEVNASFGPNLEHAGKIAVLSQSGAIGSSMIVFVNKEKIGLHSFTSLGNKVDLNENDFLNYFSLEKKVKSVFLYLESFSDGISFFEKTRKFSFSKPIVILKPGKTKASIRAMTSHTGALISDEIAFKTAFSQANLIDAENLEGFYNLLFFFSSQKFEKFQFSKKDKTAIITNAGGVGVLLSDILSDTKPTDIGGAATPNDYENAFLKLPKNLNSLFVIITPQEMTEMEKIAEKIVDFQKKHLNFPIFTIIPGGNKVNETHKTLKNNNCLVYDYPEEAVFVYKKINNYFFNRIKFNFKFQNKFSYLLKTIHPQKSYLSFENVQKLAHEYHLPINDEYEVSSLSDAEKIAKKIGYPVVLKAHSRKLIHKTEKKAVKLNINSERNLKIAYHELLSVGDDPRVVPTTISISKHLNANFEVILGIKKDPDFGHLLMFGMGGIYTEIMKDLAYGLIPLTRAEIEAIIKKTKAYTIIEGARGLPRLYLRGIIDCIEKLNKLILENQWISELDINPLLVGENFVKIVDLKVK